MKSGIEFKTKKLIKETAKDAVDTASTVQSKFAAGVSEVTEKAKKNAAERKTKSKTVKWDRLMRSYFAGMKILQFIYLVIKDSSC